MPSEKAVPAVAAEQRVVTAMYRRLDELTDRAERDLARVRRAPTAGTPAAQVEREAMLRGYTERLGALHSRRTQAVLRTAGSHRLRRTPLHRTAQPGRRGPGAAAHRLARPGGGTVLPRHLGGSDGGVATSAHPARGAHRQRRRGRRPGSGGRRVGTVRGQRSADGRPGSPAHRPDGRHRRDHPGRAGPDHPRPARGRPRRRRGPGLREDGGRTAPCGLSALHAP